MTSKQILWSILEKYDSQPEMRSFCNSISRSIQGLELSDEDILNIAAVSNLIDTQDIEYIDLTIGICSKVF